MNNAAYPDKELDELKQAAAATAVEYIRSDMIIGLGTGTTSAHFLSLLSERIKMGAVTGLFAVPTSKEAEKMAHEAGIPTTTLEEHPRLDITIDGADEVDPVLNVIKGGGGALLREKIVAQASDRVVLIVDETKISDQLGTHWPVPVEVIPFGWKNQRAFIDGLGAKTSVRKKASGNPLTTDQGNMILDCDFGPIDDLQQLAAELSQRAGIVEHGLFLSMADEVIVGSRKGVCKLKRISQ